MNKYKKIWNDVFVCIYFKHLVCVSVAGEWVCVTCGSNRDVCDYDRENVACGLARVQFI